MEIVNKTIIAGFTAEEVEKVKEVGGKIGEFKKAFEAGEITGISEETKQLLQAIIDVTSAVVNR